MYIIRLDDASELMDSVKWDKMETLLDKYGIRPIVGIIPKNEDPNFKKFSKDEFFWNKVLKWQDKGWMIAQHGYEHKYTTKDSGINPIHNRSEFAGIDLQTQKNKIKAGYNILKSHKIEPTVFFAPSHTYDENTLIAIKEETSIRIISDTIAYDTYYKDDLYYIPVQTGKPRKIFLKTVTICLHPNEMTDKDFSELNKFIMNNRTKFNNIKLKKRKYNFLDFVLKKIYFLIKKVKRKD